VDHFDDSDFSVLLRACSESPKFANGFGSEVLKLAASSEIKFPAFSHRLARMCDVVRLMTDRDARTEKLTEIASLMIESLGSWSGSERLEVVDALTSLLRADDFEGNELWSMLLFAEFVDSGKYESPSICDFFKAYVEKAPFESIENAFGQFCENLRNGDIEKRGLAVMCLAMCFEAKEELREKFFEQGPLSEELLANWDPTVVRFRSAFERKASLSRKAP
jgi:hypothetical protein